MGIDVTIYVDGPPIDDARLAAAEEFVARRVPDLMQFHCGDGPHLTRQYHPTEDRKVVELWTLCRYYGEGYERGSWPAIYAAIRVMQAAFPNHTVHYGGDDFAEPVTDERLARLWDHWLGPNGDAYHNRRETT